MKQHELIRLRQRLGELSQESWTRTLVRACDKLWVYAFTPIARVWRKNETFCFLGKAIPYFVHQYNATWRNERGVEIALAQNFMAAHAGQRVLELGNVMEYYSSVPHDVVDKYEQTPGILNIDFLDFAPKQPYDAFISISTFEHIGWDESPKRPEKVREALLKIGSLVNNRDNVLVTFPLGYNTFLDELARSNGLGFKSSGCLMRTNKRNDWHEAPLEQAIQATYGSKYQAANALFVGIGLV